MIYTIVFCFPQDSNKDQSVNISRATYKTQSEKVYSFSQMLNMPLFSIPLLTY